MDLLKTLCIIPARGGSKGIPGKNIKPLNGKPLIYYAIEGARHFFEDKQICVSTDDPAIRTCVEDFGLQVPFLRPAALAQDTSGSYEVLIHALDFFEEAGKRFEHILLLQPTSPFRTSQDIAGALALFSPELDMIVSVKESAANPYYNLFEENSDGFLNISKKGNFVRRQDCPPVYEYNGALYLIKVESLRRQRIGEFNRVKKYIMDEISSIDLDTPLDWKFCEFLMQQGYR